MARNADSLFGPARAPTYLKEWELGVSNPTLQRGTFSTNQGEAYIWAIDETGVAVLGQEVLAPNAPGRYMTLGHPTLVNGGSARLAGELVPNGSGWILNTQSGRYMQGASVGRDMIENAADRLRQGGLRIDAIDFGEV